MSKRNPKALLADDIMDPRLNIMKDQAGLNPMIARYVQQARKFVLDEQATVLAARLSCAMPGEVGRMLKVALPPAELTWIEMPTKVMQVARNMETGRQLSAQEQDHIFSLNDSAKTGLLIHHKGDMLHIYVIDHAEGLAFPRYMPWPVCYDVALEGTPFIEVMKQDIDVLLTCWPTIEAAMTNVAGVSWGYDETQIDVSPLVGRASARQAFVAGSMADGSVKAELIVEVLKQLSGITRLAVATLAMLNSVPVVYAEGRATGGRLLKGGLKPYFEAKTASLAIPRRVRRPVEFARRAIALEVKRKRLHEVRGHYRHLGRKPKASGWVEGINPLTGERCWRKPVAPHTRGDPQLGKVEPKTTIVHGPKEPL